jgi:hypothetical protein
MFGNDDEKRKAWRAVVDALDKVRPNFMSKPGTGIECAVRAIEEMSLEVKMWQKMAESKLRPGLIDFEERAIKDRFQQIEGVVKDLTNELRVANEKIKKLEHAPIKLTYEPVAFPMYRVDPVWPTHSEAYDAGKTDGIRQERARLAKAFK